MLDGVYMYERKFSGGRTTYWTFFPDGRFYQYGGYGMGRLVITEADWDARCQPALGDDVERCGYYKIQGNEIQRELLNGNRYVDSFAFTDEGIRIGDQDLKGPKSLTEPAE